MPPYLGEPWSRMTIGKVRFDNSGTDKWVAFVGGGYGSAVALAGAVVIRLIRRRERDFISLLLV